MNKGLKIILILLIITILTTLYARYIGTIGLITKEYTIKDNEIPHSFDGLKIVHFSDLHYKRAINEEKVEKIIEEINLINPDIVVFTGDLIDKDIIPNEADYEFLIKSLDKIKAKYGKYSVLGNHDYNEKEEILKVFQKSGFKYLENEYDIIYKNNEKLLIGGLGNVTYGEDFIDEIISNEEINYQITLVHEPDVSDEIIKYTNTNLILAGHSHNGQVRLPIIGAIIKPSYAEKYYDEHYKIDNTNLYISSGIGVSTLNYRLFNHPSINFYRINK